MATLKDNDHRPPWNPRRKAHEGRKNPNRHIYGTNKWTTLAKLHKVHNPVCVECEKVGIHSPAEQTDHIKPINQGGNPWDWNNLQSLCGRCHAKKSSDEGKQKQ